MAPAVVPACPTPCLATSGPKKYALLFQVKFIADVPPEGRKTETCAMEVVPPVMLLAKMLSRTSMPVCAVVLIENAAESRLVVAVPVCGPNRFTELL